LGKAVTVRVTEPVGQAGANIEQARAVVRELPGGGMILDCDRLERIRC
jgi:hypothetical protein